MSPKKVEEGPQFFEIGKITQNIIIVEQEGKGGKVRRYKVTWKAGSVSPEGVEVRKGQPAVSYFTTAEEVIHQHERVLERFTGLEIPLETKTEILKIPGEAQKMAGISAEISSLVGEISNPFSLQGFSRVNERIFRLRKEIGGVTNEYKLEARKQLKTAIFSEDERKKTQAALDANLAIIGRTQESLGIVQGTLSRLRTVTDTRNKWEETISAVFNELSEMSYRLQKQGAICQEEREQIARHISGESDLSLIGKLNQIPGPEYWERIKSPAVQKLAKIGGLLRQKGDEEAQNILQEAISKLARVPKEREERRRK